MTLVSGYWFYILSKIYQGFLQFILDKRLEVFVWFESIKPDVVALLIRFLLFVSHSLYSTANPLKFSVYYSQSKQIDIFQSE